MLYLINGWVFFTIKYGEHLQTEESNIDMSTTLEESKPLHASGIDEFDQ